MTTLRAIVADTPEVIARLRAALSEIHARPATDDDTPAVVKGRPRPPCDLDQLDMADAEAAHLVAWAEQLAHARIAGTWRRGPRVLGIRDDNLRPVLIAVEVITDQLDAGWHDNQFEQQTRALRRRTTNRFPWLDFDADTPIELAAI